MTQNNNQRWDFHKEFKVNNSYSEELKKRAVFRVLSGELSNIEAIREYGIRSYTTLDRWLEKFGHGILTRHKELLEGMGTGKKKGSVKVKIDKVGNLLDQVKKAEKRAAEAELRAEAYSLMIDIAEQELKVAIRKKFDTK